MTPEQSSEDRWLSRFPRECGQPLFPDAWQAIAFVIAVKLADAGVFSWSEWANGLAEEISKGSPPEQEEAEYYRKWLTNLEKLSLRKNLVEASTLSQRKLDWIEAYETTPHGKPVRLATRSS